MVSIVRRAQWGARPPRSVFRIPTPTPRCWIHHTATEQHGATGVRAIQAYHMDSRGWLDIAYSFLVDDDGTIYEGRGAGVAGGHTEGDNSKSHAICFMGNFENRAATSAALDAAVDLARYGRDAGWWVPTLGGHRDAPGASTACPGSHLYVSLQYLRSLVASPTEEDDMPYSPEEIRRFAKGGVIDALKERGEHRGEIVMLAGMALEEALTTRGSPVREGIRDVMAVTADEDPKFQDAVKKIVREVLAEEPAPSPDTAG